jgi:hypothetical protein
MNKLILLFVAIFTVAFSNAVFSQREIKSVNQNNQGYTHSSPSEKEQYNSLFEKLTGTFQYQINKEDYKPLLSLEVLKQIEAARGEDSDVFIQVDQYTKIFVPSKKAISSFGFNKLETIIYSLNN